MVVAVTGTEAAHRHRDSPSPRRSPGRAVLRLDTAKRYLVVCTRRPRARWSTVAMRQAVMQEKMPPAGTYAAVHPDTIRRLQPRRAPVCQTRRPNRRSSGRCWGLEPRCRSGGSPTESASRFGQRRTAPIRGNREAAVEAAGRRRRRGAGDSREPRDARRGACGLGPSNRRGPRHRARALLWRRAARVAAARACDVPPPRSLPRAPCRRRAVLRAVAPAPTPRRT